jgi:predicted molibdopterin-dependent oxidoreductase YjgC
LRIRKAIDSPGNARPDWEIIIEIAKRMGFNIGNYSKVEDIWEEIREAAPIFKGISYKRIEKEGIQWPCYDENSQGQSTLYLDKFNTPSGKAKIYPVEYQEQNEKPTNQFPLVMNTGRLLYQYHSATMSRKSPVLNSYANDSYILVHPEDAKKYNINNKAKVKVISPRGELITTAIISEEVLPGETFMPWHFHEAPANILTRNEKDPISKIAPFKYSIIRIENI